VRPRHLRRERAQVQRDEPIAASLDPTEDLPDQATLNPIWLDQHQRPLDHVPSLFLMQPHEPGRP